MVLVPECSPKPIIRTFRYNEDCLKSLFFSVNQLQGMGLSRNTTGGTGFETIIDRKDLMGDGYV